MKAQLLIYRPLIGRFEKACAEAEIEIVGAEALPDDQVWVTVVFKDASSLFYLGVIFVS